MIAICSAVLLLSWAAGRTSLAGAAHRLRVDSHRLRASVTVERPSFLPVDVDRAVAPVLPVLDEGEEERLRRTGKLRWQQAPAAGGMGSGFAVQELRADVDDVWRTVRAFEEYRELISTVKTVTAYEPDAGAPAEPANVCRYSFLVSRLRLRLDVRFAVHEALRYASWQLDRPNFALAESTGYWQVVPCADRPGVVRVWFCVSVRLKARVPGLVIRLVSRLGLEKATRWLKDLEPR